MENRKNADLCRQKYREGGESSSNGWLFILGVVICVIAICLFNGPEEFCARIPCAALYACLGALCSALPCVEEGGEKEEDAHFTQV